LEEKRSGGKRKIKQKGEKGIERELDSLMKRETLA